MQNKKASHLIIALLLSSVITTGCAVAPPAYQAQDTAPESSDDCCIQLTEIPTKYLNIQKSVYAPVNATQAKVSFDGYPSYAVAYQLPEGDRPLLIALAATIVDQSVLSPQISLYNSQWELTRKIGHEAFIYTPQRLSYGDALRANLLINRPAIEPEVFLIVHADPNGAERRQKLIHPQALYAENRNLDASLRVPTYATLNQMGVVHLSVYAAYGKSLLNLVSSLNQDNNVPTYKRDSGSAERIPEKDTPSPDADSQVYQKQLNFYKEAIAKSVENGEFGKAARFADEAEQHNLPELKAYLFDQLKALDNQN